MKTPPVLIFLLCVVRVPTLSQEKVWGISWFDVGANQYICTEATLHSLQGDSLAVTQDSSRLWIPISSLKEMRSHKATSHGLAGAIVGAGIGAGLGYIFGTLCGADNTSLLLQSQGSGSDKTIAIAFGGFVGCGLGAAIGSSSGPKKYDFSSMPPGKKLSTLRTLLKTENK